MPHKINSTRIAQFDFELDELQSMLTENAAGIVGAPEDGFTRSVDMEPIFTVLHGRSTLHGIRLTIEDRRIAEPTKAFFKTGRTPPAGDPERSLIVASPLQERGRRH